MAIDDEKRVSLQSNRVIHAKINVLDFDFNLVEEITGVVLDGSSYTIDATSDIRRTCSITIVVKDSTFDVKYGGKIWLDKYIQIFVGIEDNKNNREVVYSNIGLYLIDNPKQMYDATNNTLSINGVDLMSKMTGLRNGYLEGITYQIKANTNIRNAMISLVKDECGFNQYSIDLPHPTITTPADLSFGLGSTVYNIIAQLRDINSNYQTYFDTDGVFNFNRIPSGEHEQIMVNDEVWERVLISYSKETNFEEVKNYIEVFGKTQDDGHTPYGIAYDDNPLSPFYVGMNNENMIRIVLSGGEYDNIFPLAKYEDSQTQFNSLAQQRADYELYLRCKLQDTLELVCIPLYWLDVNWLVDITLPNKKVDEENSTIETEKYIIKRITTNLGVNGTQNISLIKYYPLDTGSLVYLGTPITQLGVGMYKLAVANNNDYAIFSGYKSMAYAYNENLVRTGIRTNERYNPIGLSFDDYALFGGGGTFNNYSVCVGNNTVWVFDDNLTRTEISPLTHEKIQTMGTVVKDTVNNHKYAIITDGDVNERVYYQYANVYDETFTKIGGVPPLSIDRGRGSATTVGNKGIFMGMLPNGEVVGSQNDTMDVYDSNLTHTVVSIPISNMRQCADMCSTTVGGYALFAGGFYYSNQTAKVNDKKSYYNRVYAVDEYLTVKALTTLKAKYESISATTIDNYAVFTGGGKQLTTTSQFTNATWLYDDTLTRSSVTGISQARSSIASTSIGDFVLCGGGVDNLAHTEIEGVTSYRMIDVYSKI